MALFKILKGEGNLPSTKNEGWAYVRKTGSTSADFYVDYDQDTRLQIGRYAENGIFYIDGTGTTAGAWLGSHDGITEYYDGLVVLYRIPIKGASTTTLNINGLGAKTCYVNSDTSKLTTHYPATGLVLMVYDTTLNSGAGGWKVHSYRDTNTTYTLSGAASGDTWVTTLTPSSGTATTSTVPAATASSAGLMTAADKAKLNAIPADATNNVGDITGVSAGIGLTGGATSGNATLKAKLRSETKLTVDSAAATTTSERVYPVAADKSGYLAVNVPWSDTDTGATSVEITGSGNAITEASYDSTTRKLTLTKGATYSNNKGDITGVTAGKGLINGGTSGTVTLDVGAGTGIIVNDNDIAVNTGFATSNEKRNYAVQPDDDGSLYVNVPWTDTNTDTHYTTKIFAGSSGTAQNEGTTISDPYIKIADTVNGTNTYRNQIQIKGDGATTVKARSGVITINTPVQSVFSGASASAAGTSGLVPQPTAGQEGYYLRGDGTWFNLTGMDESVQNTFGALQKAWKEADTSLKNTLTTLINGKAQTNHASTGTSYGVSSDTNYGHAKASSTTPKASAATAAVGSETASFARGDHVHPLSIAHSWGGTTLTTEINGISKTVDIPTATTAAAGLMTADDKKKLDGIAAGATANTGDITGITTAATSGLTGGVTSGTATLAVNTSYTTSGKNYAVKVDSTSGGLYVNVPWTDTNTDTNYYHTPDWTSALASGQGTATGGTSTNIKIATGTGKNDMYVPVATNSKPGLTVVYPSAQCSTYTTDTGAVTPAAAKQAVTKFAKETIGMPEENTMADYVLASGDTLSGSLTFNNSNSTQQKDQPYLVWKTVGSNTPRIGFASDQSDGTFLIASLGGTTYQSGLAIGGGSGNLLWKGKKVLTVDDSYSHPAGSGASKTAGLYKFSTDSTSHISGVTAVTKADITALGIPGSDTNTTYTIATGDANGQIKVTPSSGSAYNVSVKGLGSAAYTASTDYAYKTEGAFFIEGSGTTDSTAKTSTWTGTSDRITAYYDGLTIRYKIGVAGQSTTTLNINNLGAKTVYRFSDSKLTTHFPVNSIIHLIYHEDLNGGCWMCSDYDANTNTYQRVYPSTGNVEYPITTRYATTTGASYYAEYGRYSTGVTLNPSTNTITATSFKGLATKATADASGNVITDTYATKAQAITGLSVSGKVITYTKGDGTTGTITTQDTNTHAVTSVNSKTGAVTLTYSDVGAAASSHNHDDRYYTETEVNTKLNTKLDKLTYEWNKQYSAGGTAGYLLIGSFPMYDTNVTIDIDATTNTTYHGTVVIATQNVSETSIGSAHTITVYGDPTGAISDAIRVVWTSGSRNYNVYFVPSTWSKNLIHIRAIGQYMDTIDESKICSQFTAGTAPTTTTGLTVVNALKSNFNNYVHPTTAGNKHIPAGGSSGQILKWSAAGTAAWANDHSAFSGASASAAGTAGLVPAPAKNQQGYFLRGDGSWYNFLDLNSTALDTISKIKEAWETADGTLKSTLEAAIGNKVSKTGDTMSGDLTVNANIISSGDIKGSYLYTSSAAEESSTSTSIAVIASNQYIRKISMPANANFDSGSGIWAKLVNAGVQAFSTGSSAPTDNDYFISQYASGGTSHPEFYRRPVSALWTYMDGKVATKYAKLASPNNMIHNSNETTWVPDSYNNYVWINYRSVGGTGKSTVTGYKFGNANGTTANVFVEAATFSMNDKAKMTYNATDECIEFIFA